MDHGRVLSEEILALQKEIKQGEQRKISAEKEYREKIEQLKEKIQKERRLRNEANATLEQLNKKVKDLEGKYQKELLYYKDLSQKKEEELVKSKEKLQKLLEKVIFVKRYSNNNGI